MSGDDRRTIAGTGVGEVTKANISSTPDDRRNRSTHLRDKKDRPDELGFLTMTLSPA